MKRITTILLLTTALSAHGQSALTLQQCMQYAVEHNHEVKRVALELDNYEANLTEAAVSFLPSVNASVSGQYNFGRTIDQKTNVYNDVNTFNNSTSLNASMPLFDGFNRWHALRAAKAGTLMGRLALRQQQDQTALQVLQAVTNLLYYEGLVQMAAEKQKETELLLRQTRLLTEVGRKSPTELALVEAQLAEADYELTRQQNLHASALLELKKTMAYPMEDSIALAVKALPSTEEVSLSSLPDIAQHASVQRAYYQMQASRQQWKQSRAGLYPTISLNAGLNTGYFKTLHVDVDPTFHAQYKNNLGKYIGATLSIPLFNNLQQVSQVRRARNNMQMAQEQYEQQQLELEKLSREAWQDWQGYRQQALQMQKKSEADSLAYSLTRRQFEEGLCTAIDLHTVRSQWLNSKAMLLQCRLMVMVKQQLVRYYNGETIWIE